LRAGADRVQTASPIHQLRRRFKVVNGPKLPRLVISFTTNEHHSLIKTPPFTRARATDAPKRHIVSVAIRKHGNPSASDARESVIAVAYAPYAVQHYI
jgi:hypothetical protein